MVHTMELLNPLLSTRELHYTSISDWREMYYQADTLKSISIRAFIISFAGANQLPMLSIH